jgi:hypothetical protein
MKFEQILNFEQILYLNIYRKFEKVQILKLFKFKKMFKSKNCSNSKKCSKPKIVQTLKINKFQIQKLSKHAGTLTLEEGTHVGPLTRPRGRNGCTGTPERHRAVSNKS